MDDWWVEFAACRSVGGDWWYADETANGVADMRRAKQVCRGCDVRIECLEWALAHDERFGVWGGLSPRQRAGLRRQRGLPPARQVAPCGTEAGGKAHRRRGERPCASCLSAEALYRRRRKEEKGQR